MKEELNLYRLTTKTGDYFAVATDPTEAAKKVEKYLNDADYGFSNDRQVTVITLLAKSTTDLKFVGGKNLVL